MATIDSKEQVERIIAANGKLYEDEEPVVKIVKYDNAFGGVGYGLIFRGQPRDLYAPSAYINNPETIFEAD